MSISISFDKLTPEDQTKYSQILGLESFEAAEFDYPEFSEEELQAQEEWMLNNSPETKLRSLEEELHAEKEKNEKLEAKNENQKLEIGVRDEKIEALEAYVAKLARAQFGKSSEQRDSKSDEKEQIQPEANNSEEDQKENAKQATTSVSATPTPPSSPVKKPSRNPLPENLPSEPVEHPAPSACSCCGSTNLSLLKKPVRKMLSYVRGYFKTKMHILPKVRCRKCGKIDQAPTPSWPIVKGKADASVITDVLYYKFCCHVPLNRLIAIYESQGVKLSSSTLSDWVYYSSDLLEYIYDEIAKHVRMQTVLYVDDTPIPVFSDDREITTGRVWPVLCDGRPYGSDVPPAVFYFFSSDRTSKTVQELLKNCKGAVHIDGYSGYNCVCKPDPITGKSQLDGVGCWAHVRRNFHDVSIRTQSPAAESVLDLIGKLFAIEEKINGQPPDRRMRAREAESKPILNALETQMKEILKQEPSKKSELAKAIHYAQVRWRSLIRYTTDGRLEMTNNAAERAIRSLVIGRKNWQFLGSNRSGHSAAIIYTIIETCKMNGIEPYAYLLDILTCIAAYPRQQLKDLLPWNFYRNKLPQAVTLH